MTRIPKIPPIPTEYVEAIGFVVLLIVFVIIAAGVLEHIQSKSETEPEISEHKTESETNPETKSETEALREDAQDIIDMINRRDNYYGE